MNLLSLASFIAILVFQTYQVSAFEIPSVSSVKNAASSVFSQDSINYNALPVGEINKKSIQENKSANSAPDTKIANQINNANDLEQKQNSKNLNRNLADNNINIDQANNPLSLKEKNRKELQSNIENDNIIEEKSQFQNEKLISNIYQDKRYKGVNKIPKYHLKTTDQNDITRNIQEEVNGNLNNDQVRQHVEELQAKGEFNKLFIHQNTTAPIIDPSTPADPSPSPSPVQPANQIQKSGVYVLGNISDTISYLTLFSESVLLNSSANRILNTYTDAISAIGTNLTYSGNDYSAIYNPYDITINSNTYQYLLPYYTSIGADGNSFNLTNWLTTTSFQIGNTGNSSSYANDNIGDYYNGSIVQANAHSSSTTTVEYTVTLFSLMNLIMNIPGARLGFVNTLETLISNSVFFVNIATINNNISNLDQSGPTGQIMALIDYMLRIYFPGNATYQFQAQHGIVNDKNPYVNTVLFSMLQATANISSDSFSNLNSYINGGALISQTYSFDLLPNGTYNYISDNLVGYAQYQNILQDLINQGNQSIANGIYPVAGELNLSFTDLNSNITNLSGGLQITVDNTILNFGLHFDSLNSRVLSGSLTGVGATELLNLGSNFNTFKMTMASPDGRELNFSAIFAARDNNTNHSLIGAFATTLHQN